MVLTMREVGIFEAKTRLSSLINDVEKGERFTITKRNLPVAMLIPIDPDISSHGQAAVERILELGKQLGGRVSIEEIIQCRDDGRK